MRVLITGGAGFIGSHVADGCLEAGHEVVVVDDLSSGRADNVPTAARSYQVDIRDAAALERLFAAERPDIVNHHAAQVSVRRSVEAPLADAAINILGSVNVLETARRHGVRRVIFASTGGAIYGEQDTVPTDETHPCRPRSPYAVAKLAVEHYVDYYRAMFHLEGVILRYANVYGPRQDPHGEAGVVAIFLHAVLAGRPPTIFGDGEQLRDYIYVGDVVAANLAALQVPAPAAETLVVNIATARGTSVNELWRVIAATTAPAMRPRHGAVRPGDVQRSVLDPSRAERVLGWTASVDLAEGVRRTWEWFTRRE